MIVSCVTPEKVLEIGRQHRLIDKEIVCSSEAYVLYCGEEITEEMLGVREFEELGLLENDPLTALVIETNENIISAIYQIQENNSVQLYSIVKQDLEDMDILDVVSLG